jgi:hypothetical protein
MYDFWRSTRERAAAHEAGHAIVAWRSQFVLRVECVYLEGNSGWTVCEYCYRHSRAIAAYWHRIAIDLAGLAGEMFVYHRSWSTEATGDLLDAKKLAERLLRERPPRRGKPPRLPWRNGIGVPKLDVTAPIKPPPEPNVVFVMNACYRKARYLIGQNAAPFMSIMNGLLRFDRLEYDALVRLIGPP